MEFTTVLLTIGLVVANVLGVAMLVPQADRIVRKRSLDGVSAEWIGMGAAINAGWLVYAWTAQVWGIAGVSLGGLGFYLAMAIGVRRLDPACFGRAQTTALIITNVLGWAAAIGSVEALGLTLAALFTVQFAPAAWSAWTASNLDGVSTWTWILDLGEALIWAMYGAAVADRALVLGGVGASTMSALILIRLWRGPIRRRVAVA